MKLAFHLVAKKEALWVRFLRVKYKCEQGVPYGLRRSNCSRVWKETNLVLNELRDNILHCVGHGRPIDFWRDNCISVKTVYIVRCDAMCNRNVVVFDESRNRIASILESSRRLKLACYSVAVVIGAEAGSGSIADIRVARTGAASVVVGTGLCTGRSWLRPEVGWTKLNTNGSCERDHGHATCGDIVHILENPTDELDELLLANEG
ncbi:hypothetical protein V6N13_110107 [Hibiscus sabdariffa]